MPVTTTESDQRDDSTPFENRDAADLQTGHVPLDLSHGIMQGSWNGCLHGRVTMICSAGSSVVVLNWSLQTAHSFSSNGAAGNVSIFGQRHQGDHLHPSSSTSRGSFSTISSVAGTGCDDEFSMIWDMI